MMLAMVLSTGSMMVQVETLEVNSVAKVMNVFTTTNTSSGDQ
jgi:hypothetical protein